MAMSEFEKKKRKLARDYEVMLKDAEGLIAALPGELEGKAKEARERLQETVDHVKEQAKSNYDVAEEKVYEQAKKTDELIKEYPYHSAGIALGVGLLCGLLLRRGR